MILVKTDAGQQTLRDRSVRLTPRQRSAFILCDGKRSVDDVLSAGMGILQGDLDHIIDLGLLSVLRPAQTLAVVRQVTAESTSAVGRIVLTEGQGAQATQTLPLEVMSSTVVAPAFFAAIAVQSLPVRSRQQRYQDAYPIATRLTGALGLRGFRLNLSVEGTSSYDGLLALAPKIRAAVGADKAAELDRALEG
jgi:hypothetical protein